MSGAVADASTDRSTRIDSVITRMKEVLADVGITMPGLMPRFEQTSEKADPFDQSLTWFYEWRDTGNNLMGSIQLHESGKVFAEYDVVKVHPMKPGWFIEAVSVWGKPENLRSELRLIQLPE